MLCLSRKVGESILIGNDIEVRVYSIRGGQVKLAIEAPPNVRIVRPDAKNKEALERK